MTPLVDVALVTYNHEKYIAQAIESVLMQRTDFAWRLIVGDDCSTDNTQAIVREYARRYPDRITTELYAEHRGILHPERVGIRVLDLCTAKYVALLDGDDRWTSPEKLQKQVDYLEAHPECSLCFHNVLVFDEDGGREPWNYCPPHQKEVSTLEDLLAEDFIHTCSTMFRRERLGRLPTWFHAVSNGDWILHILSAEQGTIGYLDEVMAAYRVHGGGLWSSQKEAQHIREMIKTLEYVDEHLGFKYRKQIKAIKSERYYRLSEVHRKEGDWAAARSAALRGFLEAPWNGRLRQSNVLKLFFRLQFPGLYEFAKEQARSGRMTRPGN